MNLNSSISRPLSGTSKFLAAMPAGVPYDDRSGRRNKIIPPMAHWTLAASRKTGPVRFPITGGWTNATTYICLNLSLESPPSRPPTSPAHLWVSESRKPQSASCGCPQISMANALPFLGLAQWGQR